MGMGSHVEDAGFTAVGVAHKGHTDGLGAVVDDVLQSSLLGVDGAVVVVVGNLPLRLFGGYYLHLLGVGATQRYLEVHDTVFDRVVQRGVENGSYLDSFDETHLYNAFAEGSVARDANYNSALSAL